MTGGQSGPITPDMLTTPSITISSKKTTTKTTSALSTKRSSTKQHHQPTSFPRPSFNRPSFLCSLSSRSASFSPSSPPPSRVGNAFKLFPVGEKPTKTTTTTTTWSVGVSSDTLTPHHPPSSSNGSLQAGTTDIHQRSSPGLDLSLLPESLPTSFSSSLPNRDILPENALSYAAAAAAAAAATTTFSTRSFVTSVPTVDVPKEHLVLQRGWRPPPIRITRFCSDSVRPTSNCMGPENSKPVKGLIKMSKFLSTYVNDGRWYQTVKPCISLTVALHDSLILLDFYLYLERLGSINLSKVDAIMTNHYGGGNLAGNVLLLFEVLDSLAYSAKYLPKAQIISATSRLIDSSYQILQKYNINMVNPNLTPMVAEQPSGTHDSTAREVIALRRWGVILCIRKKSRVPGTSRLNFGTWDSADRVQINRRMMYLRNVRHHLFHLLIPKWEVYRTDILPDLLQWSKSPDFSFPDYVQKQLSLLAAPWLFFEGSPVSPRPDLPTAMTQNFYAIATKFFSQLSFEPTPNTGGQSDRTVGNREEDTTSNNDICSCQEEPAHRGYQSSDPSRLSVSWKREIDQSRTSTLFQLSVTLWGEPLFKATSASPSSASQTNLDTCGTSVAARQIGPTPLAGYEVAELLDPSACRSRRVVNVRQGVDCLTRGSGQGSFVFPLDRFSSCEPGGEAAQAIGAWFTEKQAKTRKPERVSFKQEASPLPESSDDVNEHTTEGRRLRSARISDNAVCQHQRISVAKTDINAAAVKRRSFSQGQLGLGSPTRPPIKDSEWRQERDRRQMSKKYIHGVSTAGHRSRYVQKFGVRHVSQNLGGRYIDDKSPFYVLALALMVGLKMTVELCKYMSKLRSPECSDFDLDFCNEEPLLNIRQIVLRNIPSLRGLITCQFIDFASDCFARIRSMSGIDTEDYIKSLCRTDFSFIEFQSNSKSGQFFFFSHDGKYLIKTVTARELKRFLRLLPNYINHLRNTPNSLLSRVFGIHRLEIWPVEQPQNLSNIDRVELESESFISDVTQETKASPRHGRGHSGVNRGNKRSVFIIVLGSIYDPQLGMHEMYDLKGSKISRKAKPSDRIKKDVDWLALNRRISLRPSDAQKLICAHQADSIWLRENNIFDYSLLVGIHNKEKASEGVQGFVQRHVTMLTTKLLAVHWAQKLQSRSEPSLDELFALNMATRNPNTSPGDIALAPRKMPLGGLLEDSTGVKTFRLSKTMDWKRAEKQQDRLPLPTPSPPVEDILDVSNSQEGEPSLIPSECIVPAKSFLDESTLTAYMGGKQNVLKKGNTTESAVSPKAVVLPALPTGGVRLLGPDSRTGFGTKALSSDGSEMYFIGIIDFITRYTGRRYLHTAWKYIKTGFHGEISPMPPAYYSRRQIKFVRNKVVRLLHYNGEKVDVVAEKGNPTRPKR